VIEIDSLKDIVSIEHIGKSGGYDGHSLRAFSYFGELMPDIKEAPEGEECYHFIAEGENYYVHETEIVDYCGTTMTGKELYELLTNSRISGTI
jgi:hypothetical protein